MKQRILILAVLVLLLVLALPVASAQTAPLCFPEAAPAITHCIDGRFRTFWEQQGGLPIFGYPLSDPLQKPTEAGSITVQQFERAQLELHPENSPPYAILLSRLGAIARAGKQAAPPDTPRDGCLFFSETGQNLCPPFLNVWQSAGLEFGNPGVSQSESLALFGLPLTAPQPCTVDALCPTDGPMYTVQWFERARFEDHGAQGVMLGLLGREQANDVASSDIANTPIPTPDESNAPTLAPTSDVPAAPTILPSGGFIEVDGSQLVRLGQPVELLGVTYRPHEYTEQEDLWRFWNEEQIAQDLRLAHEELGINVVRVRLPYVIPNIDSEAHVTGELVDRIRHLAQIAGSLNMRLMISLFANYDAFPMPGRTSEDRNITYLERLVGNFQGDERIVAWDVYQRPDRHAIWRNGDEPRVVSWLVRMANTLQRVAPHQLVTVTMDDFHNFWKPDFDGHLLIDYVDFLTMQADDAEEVQENYAYIRTMTDKPVVLQEFSWASGPPCRTRKESEETQAQGYREVLDASRGRLAGVISRILFDEPSGPDDGWDETSDYYGFYRLDGSVKPVAGVLRAFQALPLPNATVMNEPPLPARIKPPREDPDPNTLDEQEKKNPKRPLKVENGHYVKDWFRRAWDRLGGRASFGLPLSEAFERAGDDRVVQYFEGAVLELHREVRDDPEFGGLGEVEEIEALVRPVYLGSAYTQGRTFPPADPESEGRRFSKTEHYVKGEFLKFYERASGEWRLGNPLSEEFTEAVNGAPTRVQYFEKGRLEWNPTTGAVQVGQLGSWAWNIQCQYAPY